jgi:hypothetical protein
MALEIVQVQSSVLPTGAATEATLAALSSKFPASIGQKVMAASLAVVLASDQSAIPVTGTVAISGTVPVSGTVSISGTVPVSAAALPLPTGASTEATLAALSTKFPTTIGQKAMAASLAVVLASDQSAIPVTGPQTDTQLRAFAVTNWVTATGVVNTVVTATLPAPGAGLFHYIVSIELVRLYAVVGTANAAGQIVTTTNLPGTPAWTTEQAAGALGTAPKVIVMNPSIPIKSAVANTATTFVAPANASAIWRWNVVYYTGP